MKKLLRILLFILATLTFFVCLFLVYVNINTEKLTEASLVETQTKTFDPKMVKVGGIKLYTQPDAYTCGVTTVCTVVSFLSHNDLQPEYFIEKYSLAGGMTTSVFSDILVKELPGYEVTYQHGQSDLELIQTIYRQLKNGVPVPVFFGAANPYNKPYNDFHASVVAGIDLENQMVDILNVYGYEEQVSVVEFLNRMSYRGTKDYPIVQRAVLKLGLMDKNSVFVLAKK